MSIEARRAYGRFRAAQQAAPAFGLELIEPLDEIMEAQGASSSSTTADQSSLLSSFEFSTNVQAGPLTNSISRLVARGRISTYVVLDKPAGMLRALKPRAAGSRAGMVILSASGVWHRMVFGGNSLTGSSTVDPAEKVVQVAIREFRATTGSVHGRKISDRLEELFAEAKIEDPDQVGIAPGSLSTFSLLYRRNPRLRCPALSLTPNHNLYATWKAGNQKLFSAHFLAHRTVRFVIFAPDRRHPREMVRLSGQVSVDVLLETIAPHGVLDWILE